MIERVGRTMIEERSDALIVTAPFLSQRRAMVLAVTTIGIFAFLATLAFGAGGHRSTTDVVGAIVVFGGCGYFALILALNRTVTTIRRDRIVVRYGPIPMWPARTIDAARVEDVHAAVATGVTKFGGRIALDEVNASLVGGGSITLVDDAGDTPDAERIARLITTWLWTHVP